MIKWDSIEWVEYSWWGQIECFQDCLKKKLLVVRMCSRLTVLHEVHHCTCCSNFKFVFFIKIFLKLNQSFILQQEKQKSAGPHTDTATVRASQSELFLAYPVACLSSSLHWILAAVPACLSPLPHLPSCHLTRYIWTCTETLKSQLLSWTEQLRLHISFCMNHHKNPSKSKAVNLTTKPTKNICQNVLGVMLLDIFLHRLMCK